jgi:hypothetical protein
MDVVSNCPFRAASLLWQSRPGNWILTVIAKGTFRLQPEESPLAEEQDEINEDDTHWGGDKTRSVYAPGDLVPYKPRADVLLVGSAFSPRKEPVRSLIARLIVGDVDKSIEVFGERTLTRDGQLREGFPFAKMPVRYERASGGPDTLNPVGMRVDGQPGPQGTIQLPNLQPRVLSISSPDDAIPPVGFGPIAPSWPARRAMLGRAAASFPQPGWNERPIPEGVPAAYFNAAPGDQQLDVIRESERIVLENLHAEYARLSTTLPGLRARALIERPSATLEELRMRADTLWIDTDRGVCTVTWRGQVPLRQKAEDGRVVVSMSQAAARPQRSAASSSSLRSAPVPTLPGHRSTATPRFPAPPLTPEGLLPDDRGLRSSKPTGHPSPPTTEPPAPSPEMDLVSEALDGSGEITYTGTDLDGEMFSEGELTSIEPPALSGGGPPTFASAEPRTPAARSTTAPAGAATINPAAASQEAPVASAVRGVQPLRPSDPNAVTPMSFMAMSSRVPTRDVLKLVWLDPTSVPRIRAERRFRAHLSRPDRRALGSEEGEVDLKSGAAQSAKDRRDVLSLLANGEAISENAIRHALVDAVSEEGTLDPPLVLVAGDLEFLFDELAALRATVTAASPIAASDEHLREALEKANALLNAPWPAGAGGIAAGLLAQVKEALAQAGRVPTGSLEAHTERMLLEQRCYQTRTLFGRRWIRAILRGSGGAIVAGGSMPVYLPEALKDELPLFRRIRVRLLGEADLQEDQAESSGCSLKVMAVARFVGLP